MAARSYEYIKFSTGRNKIRFGLGKKSGTTIILSQNGSLAGIVYREAQVLICIYVREPSNKKGGRGDLNP